MLRKTTLMATLGAAVMLAANVTTPMAFAAPASPVPGHHGMKHEGGPAYFAKQLQLTEQQKAQIKAIAQKYRAQHKAAPKAENWKQLHQILAAPTLDKAALKQFLEARQQARTAEISTRVKMLAEMRAVLTGAQRQQLAQLLSKPLPQPKGPSADAQKRMHDRVVKALDLNASQAQAFDQLQAQIRTQRQGKRGAMRQAFAEFARTGDTGALERTLDANAHALPVDAIVDFAATLTPEQRAKALHHLMAMRGRHGHHGHGPAHPHA